MTYPLTREQLDRVELHEAGGDETARPDPVSYGAAADELNEVLDRAVFNQIYMTATVDLGAVGIETHDEGDVRRLTELVRRGLEAQALERYIEENITPEQTAGVIDFLMEQMMEFMDSVPSTIRCRA